MGEFNKLVGQATDVALIDILQKVNLEDIRPVRIPNNVSHSRRILDFLKPRSHQIVNGWVSLPGRHPPKTKVNGSSKEPSKKSSPDATHTSQIDPPSS
jgi:hypothetical protein